MFRFVVVVLMIFIWLLVRKVFRVVLKMVIILKGKVCRIMLMFLLWVMNMLKM